MLLIKKFAIVFLIILAGSLVLMPSVFAVPDRGSIIISLNEVDAAEPLWTSSVEASNVAISADGSLVAAIKMYGGVFVYDSSGNLLWSWNGGSSYYAVEVSSDGNVVVVSLWNSSDYTYRIAYWKNAKSLRGTPQPTWLSSDLDGRIGRNALAVSSNGDVVVAVGTGPNVLYWRNALSKSGVNVYPTWTDSLSPWNLEYVKISDNGDTVLVGGSISAPYEVKIYYYKNCLSRQGYQNSGYDVNLRFTDMELKGLDMSANGMYFVIGTSQTVLFYDEGIQLWNSTLTYYFVRDVKVSADGNTVAVAAITEGPSRIYIYKQSTAKSGEVGPDSIMTITNATSLIDVYGLSMDGSGQYIAIRGVDVDNNINLVLTLTIDGDGLWKYYDQLHSFTDIEVSGSGEYVAASSAPLDSIYYFSITPPQPSQPSIFEKIKHVREVEDEAENALKALDNLNMSLEDISKHISETNYTYPTTEGGNFSEALNKLHEAYVKLKNTIVLLDIPPIPVGSEAYVKLTTMYGPMLEKYPSVSGRIQLLYAILFRS